MNDKFAPANHVHSRDADPHPHFLLWLVAIAGAIGGCRVIRLEAEMRAHWPESTPAVKEGKP